MMLTVTKITVHFSLWLYSFIMHTLTINKEENKNNRNYERLLNPLLEKSLLVEHSIGFNQDNCIFDQSN